jgi:hypothetical protein
MLTVSYIIRIVNYIKHDQVDIGSTPNSEGSNGTKNTNSTLACDVINSEGGHSLRNLHWSEPFMSL